jgi:outer membrane receptor protein involved in Fe transport
VDLRAAWRAHPDLTLHLNLANLLDEHYRAHGSGFDMPGFDVRIGLTAGF